VATVRRVAPIFPVRDLDRALKHYERLGFGVRAWSEGNYGFAVRDGVEIHLGMTQPEDRCTGTAYLFVDNADKLAAEWRAAGIEVREPEDTEWGQHEGVIIDPDGNTIRFGSPVRAADG
jgi:catechol 2,3-dioxygenase-like lactoylglutathione lyase family enzyme